MIPDKGDKVKKPPVLRIHMRSVAWIILIYNYWMKKLQERKFDGTVKRTVGMVIRRKAKKGILTAAEKLMLSKRPEFRPSAERRRLVTLISSLKCFARYPPTVRSRLARATYFMAFPAGKTLVKEGHFASAMYFILDGEIIVSQRELDLTTNEFVDKAVGIMGPGDMFGEVALLDKIPRTATCISATDVELLCVYSSDFDRILRDTLLAQWEQVRLAVRRFEFFHDWNDVQLRECCILARIKQYNPLQTIYCEDRGLLNFVYFVISGQCMILQCLKMKTSIVNKKKKYTLCKINLKQTPSEQLMAKINQAAEELYKKNVLLAPEFPQDIAKRISKKNENLDEAMENVLNSEITIEDLNKKPPINPNIMKDREHAETNEDDPNIEYRFVDVGSFNSGGVFGLGEGMEHRTIMAKTTVQCLVLPRYWLFQKDQNIANIWQRTKMYLDSTIPSREELFQDFLSSLKWEKYRKNLLNSIVSRKPKTNPTRIEDVPIICRILEGDDG